MLYRSILERYVLFFIFSIILTLKFYFVRTILFTNETILQTLFGEIVYILFLLAIVELIKSHKVKVILYLTLNFLITTLLFGLMLYFNYSGRIVSIMMLSQINQVLKVSDSIFDSLHPLYLLLYLDFILILLVGFTKKLKLEANFNTPSNNWINIGMIVGLLIISIISIIPKKEVSIAFAESVAESDGIITYGIISYLQYNELSSSKSLSTKEIKSLKTKIYSLHNNSGLSTANSLYHGIYKDKNVVFIQLESIQNFLIDLKIDNEEITPFLNNLKETGLYFSNAYQQIASGTTSDAEFISNTSLYPATFDATTKVYGDREIPSFPRLLKEYNYTSITFHTNTVEFWNRNNLYPALGFDKWYDVHYFGKQDIIGMGASDQILFSKSIPVLKKLQESNQKYYAQFITLSSHNPFKIPDKNNTLKLSTNYTDTRLNDYLESARYLDTSLQHFFEQLEQENLLDNTIFVLYGDHLGINSKNMDNKTKNILNTLLGRDYDFLDSFNIPLIIYNKESHLVGEFDYPVGQIDILPTVSNLIGLPLTNYIHFGQDVLNTNNHLVGMRNYLPYGSFINKDIAFIPEGEKFDGTAYDLLTHNKINEYSKYKNDFNNILELIELSDIYLNSFPNRE